MPWHLLIALSVFAICGRIPAVQAAQGVPAGPLSTARLIAAPSIERGVWTVGIAIALKPKTITYWRSPGEAGVPPTFDFSASTNVVLTEVAYPAPRLIHEGDIDAAGYENEVVFPVRVMLADAGAPATLRVKVDYATCERICMPARAELTLALPPPQASLDDAAIRRAEETVPRVLDADAARILVDVTGDTAGGAPSWLVRPKTPEAGEELFAEAPEGFYLATKRDGDAFRTIVAEHPADRPVPDFVRFTLVRPTGAIEFPAPLAR